MTARELIKKYQQQSRKAYLYEDDAIAFAEEFADMKVSAVKDCVRIKEVIAFARPSAIETRFFKSETYHMPGVVKIISVDLEENIS